MKSSCWKLCAWEIPGSVDCIIRAQRKDTGEVTEHVYQKPHAAQTKNANQVICKTVSMS